MTTLPNGEAFAPIRDDFARRRILARLPVLRAQLAWHALAVLAQLQAQEAERRSRHLDWALQNLDERELNRRKEHLKTEQKEARQPVWTPYFELHTELRLAEAHLERLTNSGNSAPTPARGLQLAF